MVEMVEVVAAGVMRTPAGALAKGDLFSTTDSQAAAYAGMQMLELAPGGGDKSLLERAIAAGVEARKKLDKRLADEERTAAREAEAAAKKAEKPASPKDP